MSSKIIYDLCTPAAERRCTTLDDIRNDIHVETHKTPDEIFKTLLDLTSYDADEIAEEEGWDENTPLLDKIQDLLSCFDDPGDGSPNILYLNVEGDELVNDPYVEFEDLDLSTATKKDILQACVEAYGEDY